MGEGQGTWSHSFCSCRWGKGSPHRWRGPLMRSSNWQSTSSVESGAERGKGARIQDLPCLVECLRMTSSAKRACTRSTCLKLFGSRSYCGSFSSSCVWVPSCLPAGVPKEARCAAFKMPSSIALVKLSPFVSHVSALVNVLQALGMVNPHLIDRSHRKSWILGMRTVDQNSAVFSMCPIHAEILRQIMASD